MCIRDRPEGELIVNSSQGGGSKDTWVLADASDLPPVTIPEAGSPDALGLVVQRREDLVTERPKSQQEQQQQQ